MRCLEYQSRLDGRDDRRLDWVISLSGQADDAESEIGRSVGRRQHPAERQRSRVVWRVWSSWRRGRVLRDCQAASWRVTFLPDMRSSSAMSWRLPLRGEAVVPVGAEVGEVGAGVRQQVPGDGEGGVADGD